MVLEAEIGSFNQLVQQVGMDFMKGLTGFLIN